MIIDFDLMQSRNRGPQFIRTHKERKTHEIRREKKKR